jgi:hypothetical protein
MQQDTHHDQKDDGLGVRVNEYGIYLITCADIAKCSSTTNILVRLTMLRISVACNMKADSISDFAYIRHK